jgi:hypothetical protein
VFPIISKNKEDAFKEDEEIDMTEMTVGVGGVQDRVQTELQTARK